MTTITTEIDSLSTVNIHLIMAATRRHYRAQKSWIIDFLLLAFLNSFFNTGAVKAFAGFGGVHKIQGRQQIFPIGAVG